jgi:hypothetical protein
MNKAVNEKNGMPSVDEAMTIASVLGGRGIVGINYDEWQCKRKIIELGLSMPDGKNPCLIYGREGDTSLYLFVRVPEAGGGPGRLSFVGFRFDIVKYRSSPVPGMGGAGEAFLAFMGAVAKLEGFDLATCTFEAERPVGN